MTILLQVSIVNALIVTKSNKTNHHKEYLQNHCGDIVYLHSEKSKTLARRPYLVSVDVCHVPKFTESQLQKNLQGASIGLLHRFTRS